MAQQALAALLQRLPGELAGMAALRDSGVETAQARRPGALRLEDDGWHRRRRGEQVAAVLRVRPADVEAARPDLSLPKCARRWLDRLFSRARSEGRA